MIEKFHHKLHDLILSCTGACDVSELIRCVAACGFDPAAYIASHEDLRSAKLAPAEALLHFLSFGWRENRTVTAGPFPSGLNDIFQLPIENVTYKNGILSALFLGGIRSSNIIENLWAGNIDRTILELKARKAKPFFVIGDSHSEHYGRVSACQKYWLAPLLLTCTAGSAGGLANKNSKSQYRNKILSWAEAIALLKQTSDLPILMKFGQVDAEFVWYFRRIRDGIDKFSINQFTLFAAQSVRQYSGFLKDLKKLVGSDRLRVCSIFPPALSDQAWAGGYVNDHIGILEGDRTLGDLQSGIRSLEKPNLLTRTHLHAIYNGLLEDACTQIDINFIDDFHPFLNINGTIDDCYISESKGQSHHIDFNQTAAVIVAQIRKIFE